MPNEKGTNFFSATIDLLHDPRRLLLVDGCGAGATALLTYLLFGSGRFDSGLSVSLLRAMSIAATGYVIFDLLAWTSRMRPEIPLRIIAGLNVLYGLGTMTAMVLHRERLTAIGTLYFGIEIGILLTLAWWESRVASRCPRRTELASSRRLER